MTKGKHSKNGKPIEEKLNIRDPYKKVDDTKGLGGRTLVEKVLIPVPPDYSKIHIEMKGDRILVQTFPQPTQIGAIYTPDNLELPIDRGRICNIGPDVKKLKVGDIIYKVAGLGQSLAGADKRLYTFHPESAAIAVDTFPHKLTPEPEPLHKGDIIT